MRLQQYASLQNGDAVLKLIHDSHAMQADFRIPHIRNTNPDTSDAQISEEINK